MIRSYISSDKLLTAKIRTWPWKMESFGEGICGSCRCSAQWGAEEKGVRYKNDPKWSRKDIRNNRDEADTHTHTHMVSVAITFCSTGAAPVPNYMSRALSAPSASSNSDAEPGPLTM